MLHPALVPLAAVLSSAAPGEADGPGTGASPAALAAPAAAAPLRDAAVCNVNKKVKAISVGPNLHISVTMQDNTTFRAFSNREYDDPSGNAIYNLAVTAFLSGANLDLIDSGGVCDFFDNVSLSAP